MTRHSPAANPTLALSLSLLAATGFLAVPAAAGPLNPPGGPVTSSYKTLAEVEPRTAVNATNTPGTATGVFRMIQPGSYYLTGNIAGVASKHGIEITVSNVTLDLNGFEVVGVGGAGAFDGVTIAPGPLNLTGITILNGTVRNWARIRVNLSSNSVSRCRVEGVRASGCGSVGFGVGANSVVSGCTAAANLSSGISTQSNCTVTRCTSTGNTFTGIGVGDGCAVSDCTASDNGTNGFVCGSSTITGCAANGNAGDGIDSASEGTIANCTAADNTVGIRGGVGAMIIGCTANSNSSTGITINDGGSIINCTTRGNPTWNIVAADGCLVRSNSCFGNVAAPVGTNIRVTGGENRIEGNSCTGATKGYDIEVAGNILTGNTARGNTTNWDVAVGNYCLVIQATATAILINGNSGGSSLGSTNPFANFTY